jgi:ADP-dependent NAD(P)H-hydrate dehydratase / NAD(P)H-hydrate epimerase
MREIDHLTTDRFRVPSLTLMENAATAVARAVVNALSRTVASHSVLIFCGRGNNGGDGAATARLLATAGARVDLVLIGRIDDTKGDARVNFDLAKNWNEAEALREARASAITESGLINLFECDSEKGWEQLLASVLAAPHGAIVDALFGTGLTRPVERLHRQSVDYINRQRSTRDTPPYSTCPIISVDIPSGLNSDSELPIGATVQADVTVTMTAPKRANAIPPASHLNGRLIVAEIGSPGELLDEANSDLFLIEEDDARRWLIETRYTPGSYKNTHGHALIIAGSRGFTGAAALCGNAAMRVGAGLVTVATPASAQPLVATQVMPEVMTTALAETDRGAVTDEAVDYALRFAERADVIALGPGLSSEDERTRKFVREVVERRRTAVVIDADGLNCLAPWPNELRGSDELAIVLTPHPGEMLRLLGTNDKSALNDRVTAARAFATKHHVILMLKGSRAIIAAPDGRVFINATGNAGLGTAGAGDTLTGVITGCIAQAAAYITPKGRERVSALDAVIAAVYLSGLAGDLAAQEIGMRAMVASDIREHLSAAFRSVDPSGERP